MEFISGLRPLCTSVNFKWQN